MRHAPAIPVLVALLALAAGALARPALAQAPPEPEGRTAETSPARLEAELAGLRDRLEGPGGLLFRHAESLRLLAATLERGEYRRFYDWLRVEVIAPWREVQGQSIIQLADAPPGQLSPQQRQLLRHNAQLLRRVQTQLRHARRLHTRLGREEEALRRSGNALEQLERRCERRLDDYAAVDPEGAAPWRAWFQDGFRPRLQQQTERERLLGESLGRLRNWTEDPSLRDMLAQLRRVERAMEMLRRRFHF